jgi:hypothetical protein
MQRENGRDKEGIKITVPIGNNCIKKGLVLLNLTTLTNKSSSKAPNIRQNKFTTHILLYGGKT